MNEILLKKSNQLDEILLGMKKVLVAFSGGVDSTLVLKKAQTVLGKDNVLAVVVSSELFRQEEFDRAIKLAEDMDAQVMGAEMKELEDENIAENTPDSWYYSKKLLYRTLTEIAEQHGYNHVLDGMIMDDIEDFRPGLKARTEFGVRSVLQEADFYKDEVRQLSKDLDLPVWDKPASCSLASRIPYGIRMDRKKIEQIDAAEQYIMSLGFDVVRVRHHGNLARIEVVQDRIAELLHHNSELKQQLQNLGFKYISVDLEGYRTGSMNEVLDDTVVSKALVK